MELAKFYGVSTDYLLCLTENRDYPDTGLTELHLSDDMVELLKSGRINNRLLCEIATHEGFVTLMTDTEIYVISARLPTGLGMLSSMTSGKRIRTIRTVRRIAPTP